MMEPPQEQGEEEPPPELEEELLLEQLCQTGQGYPREDRRTWKGHRNGRGGPPMNQRSSDLRPPKN